MTAKPVVASVRIEPRPGFSGGCDLGWLVLMVGLILAGAARRVRI